jgi:hypothetical protein
VGDFDTDPRQLVELTHTVGSGLNCRFLPPWLVAVHEVRGGGLSDTSRRHKDGSLWARPGAAVRPYRLRMRCAQAVRILMT